jgi:hypothetical protein
MRGSSRQKSLKERLSVLGPPQNWASSDKWFKSLGADLVPGRAGTRMSIGTTISLGAYRPLTRRVDPREHGREAAHSKRVRPVRAGQ